MTKQQKLRNTAEGLLAGLAAIGFEGPWVWAHHEWETPFLRAWRAWPPGRDLTYFREFSIGGSANGRTSRGRDLLFAIKRTSPFSDFRTGPLNREPFGLTPEEYLEIHVEGASPEEWKALAAALLAELPERGRRSP